MKTKITKNQKTGIQQLIKYPTALLVRFLLVFLTILVSESCNKDSQILEIEKEESKEENEESNNPNQELELVDIKITLPSEVNMDFSKTKVSSFLETNEVAANGNSQVLVPKDGKSFVYLSDNQSNIILMGLVSKERPELNIKSTLEASLYIGLGTVFQFSEIKENFLNEFHNLLELEPFVKELESMYALDALVLNSESYVEWLNETAKKLNGSKDVIDVAKAIFVNDTSIKSGIGVFQDESDIFSVNVLNYSRRRAKAFFYKTHEKAQEQTSFVEILDPLTIGVSDANADAEKEVTAVTGLTSVQGNTLEILEGNGSNVGFTKNGPVKFELTNELSALKYEVRVIGPGYPSDERMTNRELATLKTLRIKTLLIDYVIPIITTAVGFLDIKDVEKNFEIDSNLEIITAIVASEPAGLEALEKEEYKKATLQFFKALALNAPGTELFWENVIVKGLKKVGMEGLADADDIAGKLAAPLNIVNGILTAGDILRLAGTGISANEVELFQITVSRGKVRINKSLESISANEAVRLTAKVIDDENVELGEYRYVWSTTGNYGNFSSESETDEIVFETEKGLPLLPPKTKDSIFVKVFKDENLVGKDSTIINIDNGEFKIKPNGISIQGGERLKLQIVDKDDNPIEQGNNEGLFKVFYSTIGDFGSFEGSLRYANADAENSIIYHCLERDVEKGQEKVQARIYYYDKANGNEQTLIQEVDATINIDNDPANGFFLGLTPEVSIGLGSAIASCGTIHNPIPGYSVGTNNYVATFRAVESASSYKGRILGRNGTYGSEYTYTLGRDIIDLGGGFLKFIRIIPGGIRIGRHCSLEDAREDQRRQLQVVTDFGDIGVEIIPVFN